MNKSLYDIGDELRDISARLDELDPNDAESENLLHEWMTRLSHEESDKVDRYVYLIKETEDRAVSAEARRREFQAKEDAAKNLVRRLKQALHDHMGATGRASLVGNDFRVTKQKNGGRPGVDVLSPSLIPEEFTKVTVSPDIDAISSALEAGRLIPGVELRPVGSHIRIR